MRMLFEDFARRPLWLGRNGLNMPAGNKRILIIGAGRGQVGLYKAAKAMGCTSIAASIPGEYPGLALADETCYVDITNPAEVADAAKSLNIDAVVTSCMDTGVEALGAVNDALGLRGISQEIARSSFDKVLQKRALVEGGVPTARCVFASSSEDLDEAERLFGYPLVIKRRHSQSSSGVYEVHDRACALEIIETQFADDDVFLIEEYISGAEYGAQACVVDGEIRFVMTHGDLLYTTQAPFPVGHFLPSGMSDQCQRAATRAACDAIRASRFDNCAVNIDYIIVGDKVLIIELTGRAGANGLPELVSLNYGVNYYESIIRVALGETVSFVAQEDMEAAMVKMVIPQKPGIVQSVDDTPIDDRVLDVWPFVQVGAKVTGFESAKDCIGQVSVIGESVDQCEDLANRQIARSFSIV